MLMRISLTKASKPHLCNPVLFSSYHETATALDPLRLFSEKETAEELLKEQQLQNNMGELDTRPGSTLSVAVPGEKLSPNEQSHEEDTMFVASSPVVIDDDLIDHSDDVRWHDPRVLYY